MAFENLPTWLISFGYIFVIVIAGSALFVGATKRKNLQKKKLEEEKQKQAKVEHTQTDKPELEKTEPVVKTEEKETDKTE